MSWTAERIAIALVYAVGFVLVFSIARLILGEGVVRLIELLR